MSRHHMDEAERFRLPRASVEELPLFAPEAFPTTPPAPREEQGVLPIGGTITGKYEAWRASEDGIRAWQHILQSACEQVAQGASRLSAKQLVEEARRRLMVRCDNSFTPLIARDLHARPMLRGLVEMRARKAS